MGSIVPVVNSFTAKYPAISKRQTELKIAEIAEKEKRPGDSAKTWHIRPEFEKYLAMSPDYKPGSPAAADDKQPPKKKSKPASAAALASGSSSGGSLIKRKRAEGKGETGTPASKQKKTGANSTPGALTPLVSSSSSSPAAAEAEESGPLVAPKKFKRAFGFFVKARRHEAEAEVKKEAAGNDNEVCARVACLY
jgi:hypothetical protein